MNTATERSERSRASARFEMTRRYAAHHLLRGRPAAAAVGRKDLPCQKWHCAVMNTATERSERSRASARFEMPRRYAVHHLLRR